MLGNYLLIYNFSNNNISKFLPKQLTPRKGTETYPSYSWVFLLRNNLHPARGRKTENLPDSVISAESGRLFALLLTSK